jgi:phosphopentomutase
MCGIAFDLVARGMGVGRVIARPFTGTPGAFARTTNRRDFAMEPFQPTLLDRMSAPAVKSWAIGKIEISLRAAASRAPSTPSRRRGNGRDRNGICGVTPRGLIAANLVDFDTQYGHRNDVPGYAANLERFDARLARLLPMLSPEDLLVVTADHGNDPTTPSTDHSREHVPVLFYGGMIRPGADFGTRRDVCRPRADTGGRAWRAGARSTASASGRKS